MKYISLAFVVMVLGGCASHKSCVSLASYKALWCDYIDAREQLRDEQNLRQRVEQQMLDCVGGKP
jgi:hypothetical protein